MKYQGCLLAVKDISASKHFYEKVLHQKAVMDIGVHVTFGGSVTFEYMTPTNIL